MCVAVYFIWKERNARIFKGEERNVSALCETIMETVKLKIIKLKVKSFVSVNAVEKRWGIKFFDKIARTGK